MARARRPHATPSRHAVRLDPRRRHPAAGGDPVCGTCVALLLTAVVDDVRRRVALGGFDAGSRRRRTPIRRRRRSGSAAWSSACPVLAILGAHEWGHYAACRYYDVDATLPWFLPAPLPLTGTLGAFIRLREPIPHARALFDIAVAGPLAGFVVAVPLLVAGVAARGWCRCPPTAAAWCSAIRCCSSWSSGSLWGAIPDDQALYVHPMGAGRVVRPAGDRAEPLSVRAARWRPHQLRGPRRSCPLAVARHHRRHDRRWPPRR